MARKKKEEVQIAYVDKVIEEGVKMFEDSKMRRDMMNKTIKDAAEVTGIKKQYFIKMKDYIHYRGRGWGNDCIDKYKPDRESGEVPEKYPDRVSPAFRRLCEIVDVMYTCGRQDLLDVYLKASEGRGIKITIDESKYVTPGPGEQEVINQALETLEPLQTKLCENNDYMNDTLAPAAEHQNVTPKSKFKKVVALTYKQNEGKDIRDTVQDELVDNIMYGDCLERLRDGNAETDSTQSTEE